MYTTPWHIIEGRFGITKDRISDILYIIWQKQLPTHLLQTHCCRCNKLYWTNLWRPAWGLLTKYAWGLPNIIHSNFPIINKKSMWALYSSPLSTAKLTTQWRLRVQMNRFHKVLPIELALSCEWCELQLLPIERTMSIWILGYHSRGGGG